MYIISSEYNSNNFAEFQQISKRIDLALLSKKFNSTCRYFKLKWASISINYPFTHKDGSKMFCFMTINCIVLCKKMQEEGIDPLEARVFGLFIGGTRFQFAVARPVIREIVDESEIHIVVSFFDHWMMNIFVESINLPQVFECLAGCCNSAADIHLEGPESNTQANQSVFESQSPDDRIDDCIINSLSLEKLSAFLGHVKAEIARVDGLNPSGNPRKKIKPPSFQHVPAALSSTSSFTPSKTKLSFPEDKAITAASLQGSQRELFPPGGQVRATNMNRLFTWSTSA